MLRATCEGWERVRSAQSAPYAAVELRRRSAAPVPASGPARAAQGDEVRTLAIAAYRIGRLPAGVGALLVVACRAVCRKSGGRSGACAHTSTCRRAEDVRVALRPALGELTQLAAPCIVGSASHMAVLAVVQGLGRALNVSNATPIAAPLLGVVGVLAASTLAGAALLSNASLPRTCAAGRRYLIPPASAGHTSRLMAESVQQRRAPSWRELTAPPKLRHALTDMAVGCLFFRVLGGEFARLMPSNLRRPGACAGPVSLKAKSDEYATCGERSNILEIFNAYGCHSCGARLCTRPQGRVHQCGY